MPVPRTRSWSRLPGNFDSTKAQGRVFPSQDRFGLPFVRGAEEVQPETLSLWTRRSAIDDAHAEGSGWHFFVDDYRFESVWSSPDKFLDHAARVQCILTPDFSAYADWPYAVQLWNVYRNRWLGAYWEDHDFVVVPTITWGSVQSFEFAFEGVGFGATVAVSTVGIGRRRETARAFVSGYHAMCERIQPSLVLVYGEQFDKLGLTDLAPVARYSPDGILAMRARCLKRNQLQLDRKSVV